MTKPLIILDRDGVINIDSPHFIKSPDEWIPISGSIEAIDFEEHNYLIAIATNQSGISRGLFDESVLLKIHEKMNRLFLSFGISIDYPYCPHLPEHNCSCRKPLPDMYRTISRHFSTSLEGVPVVGDSLRDLQAAVSVNATPYLVLTGKGMKHCTAPLFLDKLRFSMTLQLLLT